MRHYWGTLRNETFAIGDAVTVDGRGDGVVTEVLPLARDWRGEWRVPYRVRLDCGTSYIAHPTSMVRVREAAVVV